MDRAERIRWLAREILPHEAAVRGWLARRVRGLPNCDIDDLIRKKVLVKDAAGGRSTSYSLMKVK